MNIRDRSRPYISGGFLSDVKFCPKGDVSDSVQYWGDAVQWNTERGHEKWRLGSLAELTYWKTINEWQKKGRSCID